MLPLSIFDRYLLLSLSNSIRLLWVSFMFFGRRSFLSLGFRLLLQLGSGFTHKSARHIQLLRILQKKKPLNYTRFCVIHLFTGGLQDAN